MSLLAHTNPGFIVILAGMLAYVVRPSLPRAIITIGGPLLGLAALVLHGAISEPLATLRMLDLTLVLYQVERASIVFGLAFLIAATVNSIYALHQKDPLQDSMALIYAGAAIAATFAGDLMTVFIFWELTAISSVFLILKSGTPEAYKASMRYLGIQIFSGVLLLMGSAFIMGEFGTLEFDAFLSDGEGLSLSDDPGAIFLLVALGIKAAFPLMHNWLQDSYPKATPTGAVVLSAFTTKLAVYALLRFFPGEDALIWIGAIMTVFPVFFAVIENDLRKVLAYSLNNQVGFMVCAIGIGTPLALNGAAAHAFCHIIYKGLLFMSMGAVMYRTGTTKATELGGLYRTMPFTAIFCIIGAASISAFPLFSGFVAKSLTMSAVGHEHMTVIWMMLLFASAGVLEHSGIKIPFFAFFAHDSGKRPKEAPFNMLLAMGIAAFFCVWLGFPFLGGTEFLYGLLPYQEEASAYLDQSLWTTDHVLTQMQLLVFAALAFIVLNRVKLYPPEKRGVVLDFDWVYRRPLYYGLVWVGDVWAKVGPAMTGAAQRLSRKVYDRIEATFSPQGELSRGPLSAGMAIWTSIVLAVVMVLALIAGPN
ncbi:Na(+)/H(+) antiporter subunit D [Ponticaulis sp.]|uniref:Na(+)/H(+) antiporter subunit D n=1 Tax=Ponticaulis sp. TaxID=2020902 RepID=UPI000B6ECD4D|nr:Na(+)/H(+) antiporter subunit D [Ponticaulis sp.]OUY00292.1 MAG: Na(+)/H(+) antiporter subunit D [Hyphomonadaceae bacterium TMED5]